MGDPSELPLAVDDAALLAWAAREGRILVTCDKRTIPMHLEAHIARGARSPGVFLLRAGWSVREVLQFLVLVAHASEEEEWQDRIEYIPPRGDAGTQ